MPTFARVRYADVYDGIDVVYYGNQRQLQYDFIVAPGRRPRPHRASRVDGADARGDRRRRQPVADVGDRVLAAGEAVHLPGGGRRAPRGAEPVRARRQDRALRRGRLRRRRANSSSTRSSRISSWFGAAGEEGILDMAVDADGGIVALRLLARSAGHPAVPDDGGRREDVARERPRRLRDEVQRRRARAIVFSTLLGGSGDENFNAYYTGGHRARRRQATST